MVKAYQAQNGLHYIEKRLPVLVSAFNLFNFVSYNLDLKPGREKIELGAADNAIIEYSYDHEIGQFSEEEEKADYIKLMEDTYNFCLIKFPDIPSEEFDKAKLEHLEALNVYREID